MTSEQVEAIVLAINGLTWVVVGLYGAVLLAGGLVCQAILLLRRK